MLPGSLRLAEAFAASFHNSFTLLWAEIEGRSFGGGVLELVPSEVGRLKVFAPLAMADFDDNLRRRRGVSRERRIC